MHCGRASQTHVHTASEQICNRIWQNSIQVCSLHVLHTTTQHAGDKLEVSFVECGLKFVDLCTYWCTHVSGVAPAQMCCLITLAPVSKALGESGYNSTIQPVRVTTALVKAHLDSKHCCRLHTRSVQTHVWGLNFFQLLLALVAAAFRRTF